MGLMFGPVPVVPVGPLSDPSALGGLWLADMSMGGVNSCLPTAAKDDCCSAKAVTEDTFCGMVASEGGVVATGGACIICLISC